MDCSQYNFWIAFDASFQFVKLLTLYRSCTPADRRGNPDTEPASSLAG